VKHRISFNPLGKMSAHRKAMVRNMSTSLFKHESINTTYAKARVVQQFSERILTRARQDTVHNRRHVARYIKDGAVVNKIFTSIAPLYEGRSGGYSRIIKYRARKGDAVPIVILELIEKSAPLVKDEKRATDSKRKSRHAKQSKKEVKAKSS